MLECFDAIKQLVAKMPGATVVAVGRYLIEQCCFRLGPFTSSSRLPPGPGSHRQSKGFEGFEDSIRQGVEQVLFHHFIPSFFMRFDSVW